jgi:TM2 domain-containing membrane protein YozV
METLITPLPKKPVYKKKVVNAISVCPACGEPTREEDRFCENCGAVLTQAPPPPPPPPPPPAPQAPAPAPSFQAPSQNKKNPLLAVAASFLLVGSGQVYNGQHIKGLILFFIGLFGSFLIVPALIAWVYAWADAYRTAKRMNAGEIPYQDYTNRGILIYIVGIVAMIVAYNVLIVMIAEFFYQMEDFYYAEDACFGYECDY